MYWLVLYTVLIILLGLHPSFLKAHFSRLEEKGLANRPPVTQA